MANLVMAHIVMAQIGMTHVSMTCGYGTYDIYGETHVPGLFALTSFGLHVYGLQRYDLNSYGPSSRRLYWYGIDACMAFLFAPDSVYIRTRPTIVWPAYL